ncbi:MAG: hypothetical protein WEF50_02195 [Myxococcota bacterium]
MATTPGAAWANGVVSADLQADCDGFSVTITAALAFNYQGFLDYSIAVNPAIPGTPIERSVPIQGETANTLVTRTETLAWPAPIDGAVSISGFAHLRDSSILPVAFNGGVPVGLECTPERPAIDIEKEISIDGGATWFDADDEASAPSAEAPHGALYRLTVKNTGNIALVAVLVNDASLGLVNVPVGDLAVGETRVLTSTTPGFEKLNVPDRCAEAGTIVNVSDVSGVYGLDGSETPLTVTDADPALLLCTERPQGGEGCTPGYWKQSHHFDSWTTYLPTDSYEAVFGVDASFNKTLVGALGQGGGGEKALGRQAVAALLNAANPGVAYAYSVPEVIAIVQSAYSTRNFERAKNELARANETRCPLN